MRDPLKFIAPQYLHPCYNSRHKKSRTAHFWVDLGKAVANLNTRPLEAPKWLETVPKKGKRKGISVPKQKTICKLLTICLPPEELFEIAVFLKCDSWRFRCALYLLSLSVEAMLNPGVWKSNPDDSITQPLLFDVFRPGVLLLKAGRRQIICTGHEKTQGKAQGGLVQ